MSKLLCIICNPKPTDTSRSSMVAKEFLASYQNQNPDNQVDIINLFDYEHARIDADVLDGWNLLRQGINFDELNAAQQKKISRIYQAADNFITYDKYVFVTPMWNLGFPAELKMYIDSVCVAGKTFAYTAQGPKGLLDGKKCLHIHSNGGFHFGKEEDHTIPYLKSVMNFMGVEQFDHILIEGVDAMPDKAGSIIDKAIEQALNKSLVF